MQSQYDQSEILTYNVEEGNFTVTENALIIPCGEKQDVGVFAAQVNKDTFLELGGGENTLQAAATLATHIAAQDPEAVGGLPDVSTIEANVARRIVGAVKLKPGEWDLPLIDTNVQIVVGDKLTVANGSAAGLDKQTGGSTAVAESLEAVAANTGGFIRCILNGASIDRD
jgi:hypothetical protein